MIKTKAIFPALIPTLVLFLAEIASSENFDASISPTADPVIFAKSGDKARTRYSWISVITDRFRPGSDGDGRREVHCLPGFCWDRQNISFTIFTGEAFRDLLRLELSHRNIIEASGMGGSVSARNRSTGLSSLPVGNPLSIFGRVASKYGWAISDSRTPSLPSGKDRGFGLGYGASINIGLSSHWAFSAEWERQRYEVVNEKSNVDLFIIGLSHRF